MQTNSTEELLVSADKDLGVRAAALQVTHRGKVCRGLSRFDTIDT